MDNIDVFNIASLEIMHLCLAKFPVPVLLADEVIAETVLGYFDILKDESEHNLSKNACWEICGYTIIWLRNESYIEFRDTDLGMDGYNATLTSKGLNTLDAIPTSLNDKITFKDLFRKGVSSIPSALVTSVMTQYFKVGS